MLEMKALKTHVRTAARHAKLCSHFQTDVISTWLLVIGTCTQLRLGKKGRKKARKNEEDEQNG